MFFEEAPKLVVAMRKALEEGDMTGLGRSAHSMKRATGDFLAQVTVSAASQLESDAKREDVESARAGLATLEALVEHLLVELANLNQASST